MMPAVTCGGSTANVGKVPVERNEHPTLRCGHAEHPFIDRADQLLVARKRDVVARLA